jgi:tRNA A37 methylthiotransferase MiaB
MRRGYSREAYLELVARARQVIPNLTLSSDFISGFCSETAEEHLDTISLLKEVKYEQAFMYAYSLREKTHASHHLSDDVQQEEKMRRLQEVISTFRAEMIAKNISEVGKFQLVLVEGPAKKSTIEAPTLTGRSDGNKRCVFESSQIPKLEDNSDPLVTQNFLQSVVKNWKEKRQLEDYQFQEKRAPVAGEYVIFITEESKGQTLYGRALAVTNLMDYHHYVLPYSH